MGGSRAKENRRLKRQADRDKIEGSGGQEGVGTTAGTPTRNRGPAKRHNSVAKGTNGSNGVVRNHKSRQIRYRLTHPSKKTTSKKPKHLKRKLADAADATEEATLRQKLAEFEHRKEEFISKRIKASEDPEKLTKEPVHTSSKHSTDDNNGNEVAASSSLPKISTTGTTLTLTNAPAPLKDTSASSKTFSTKNKDGDDDDSEDDDEDVKPVIQPRQRGKRRRGRKDTSQKVAEEATKSPVASVSTTKAPHNTDADVNPTTTKKKRGKPDRDMSRYCIGRKPITDFEVGKTYQGTVKYIKSFGIFLDINCHLDAFCHVSWLQDDYVEDPTALFQEGDEVQARVVEIDRQKKRITVSMQSESFMELELKSLGSNKDYKDKKAQEPSTRKRIGIPSNTYSDGGRAKVGIQTEKRSLHTEVGSTETFADSLPTVTAHHQRFPSSSSNAPQAPGTKTPAELKRERKLARRAERRAKKEQEQSAMDTSQ